MCLTIFHTKAEVHAHLKSEHFDFSTAHPWTYDLLLRLYGDGEGSSSLAQAHDERPRIALPSERRLWKCPAPVAEVKKSAINGRTKPTYDGRGLFTVTGFTSNGSAPDLASAIMDCGVHDVEVMVVPYTPPSTTLAIIRVPTEVGSSFVIDRLDGKMLLDSRVHVALANWMTKDALHATVAPKRGRSQSRPVEDPAQPPGPLRDAATFGGPRTREESPYSKRAKLRRDSVMDLAWSAKSSEGDDQSSWSSSREAKRRRSLNAEEMQIDHRLHSPLLPASNHFGDQDLSERSDGAADLRYKPSGKVPANETADRNSIYVSNLPYRPKFGDYLPAALSSEKTLYVLIFA
jgi:hypothetical protein